MKNTKPLVSIIILNLNGLKDTIKCISSLKKTSYNNFEILLIDNGSVKNETFPLKKKFGNFIKCYRLENNLGFTGGNNWALNKTRGKYIVLLNNDTQATPGWLKPLVALLEKDKKIAVAQPKIKMMQNKSYFDYAGAAGGYIDKYGFPFTRGRIFNTQEKDTGQYDGECPIFWASGSVCIIKKSVIKKVGGLFNENLFNYMEEIDFCWRVGKAGYKVMFTSDSVVYHKVAATAGKNIIQKRYYEHRNNLYILIRNLDKKSFIKIIPIRLLLELIAYAYYIISRQTYYVKSLTKAHGDFIKKGFYIRLNRIRTLNRTQLPIYPRSIIFDHYIRRKKTFKSLGWPAKKAIVYLLFNTKKSGGVNTITQHVNKFNKEDVPTSIYTLYGKKPNNLDKNVECKNITRYFFDPKPDILVATFWPTAYIALFLKAKEKYYFIQDWEEYFYKSNILKKVVKLTYGLPLNKIVTSKYLEKKVKKYDKSNPPLSRIKCSVLSSRHFPIHKRDSYRIGKRRVNILSVISRYNPHKGPDLLQKTIKTLKKKHPNYYFTIVSNEVKPLLPGMSNFVSNPKKDRLRRLYQTSDFLLATSRTEGFFIPGLEAMSQGCVFVTTNNGGVLDYAKNNENSIVLEKLEDLWEKDIVVKLINNPEKRKRLIENGYSTVKKYYDDHIIAEMKGIFSINK